MGESGALREPGNGSTVPSRPLQSPDAHRSHAAAHAPHGRSIVYPGDERAGDVRDPEEVSYVVVADAGRGQILPANLSRSGGNATRPVRRMADRTGGAAGGIRAATRQPSRTVQECPQR